MLSRLLAPPLCWSCGGVSRPCEPLCLGCRRMLRYVGSEVVDLAGVRTWSAVAYEGPARELVRGLKFRGATALADAMAALMVANAPEGVMPRTFEMPRGAVSFHDHPVASGRHGRDPPWLALVPVPLHPARRRSRGFNQAAVLAQALATRTGCGVVDCLSRSGPAGSQVGRPRGARLAAPPGRIRTHGCAPERAIIVDDVATTGATLAACARALRAGGAREVTAITFARTLGR
jgi:predicted amidophosphoribosyltransferase